VEREDEETNFQDQLPTKTNPPTKGKAEQGQIQAWESGAIRTVLLDDPVGILGRVETRHQDEGDVATGVNVMGCDVVEREGEREREG
jgi:hypothetical protein